MQNRAAPLGRDTRRGGFFLLQYRVRDRLTQVAEEPATNQLGVDRGEPGGEDRVGRSAEESGLSVHRPACPDQEVGIRQKRAAVDRLARNDHAGSCVPLGLHTLSGENDDLRAAIATPGPVVVDVRVTREENTYPMIAPGAPARNMVG